MEAEAIAELYDARLKAQSEDFTRMREIQAVINGEIVLPLPELTADEKPAVANLAQQGMSQLARRIASVEPTYYFPPLNPSSKDSVTRSEQRHRITTGWVHDNKMKRRIGKRARYLLAYACCPVVIKPRRDKKIPRWVVKDPLHTFPGEDTFEDYLPSDVIFEQTYTWKALRQSFGQDAEGWANINSVQKPLEWNLDNDYENDEVEFTVLEYINDEYDCLVLCGHELPDGYPGGTTATKLAEARNLANHPLCVMPGSISLDKQLGHFDGIIGMYQAQAALMAMSIVAQRRAVWPREWLVAHPGENPEVISVPDPYSGTPGELRGGSLERQDLDPSMRALETMDRLEYAERMTAALPAEFGGMSGTNVRTGRRGAQVMGASIDFTIAESQDILADSLMEENKVAIAIDKAYFNRKKIYHIATRGFSGSVEYKAKEVWETDAHIVDYPIAGTDLQNLPIEGGQRVAMQTLSRRGFMQLDPVVKDVDSEIQQIHREGVESAFLTSIQTLASNPEGPYQPIDLATLDEKLASGMALYEAVIELQKEVQERQAREAEDAAASQPGLSLPGQGVEEIPTIPEGEPSMQNLTGLLGQLGTAQTARAYRPTG